VIGAQYEFCMHCKIWIVENGGKMLRLEFFRQNFWAIAGRLSNPIAGTF